MTGGAAVELVHVGSLYHDDVIDEAETRRGVPSVNARWSNIVAILAGDYLLAQASSLAASLGADVAGLLAATIGELCRGQVLELQHLFDVTRTEESYLSSIEGKTASLMATASRIGAMVSNVSADSLDALTQFGHHLGMCFQVVDDVLDVTRTEAELGKPTGNDVHEGVYTLPVIYAVARSEELRSLLGRKLEWPQVDAGGRADRDPRGDRRVDDRRTHARDEGVRGAGRRDRARPRRVRPAADARRRARPALELRRVRPAAGTGACDLRAVFMRRVDAWLAADLDAYMDCWADDMVIELPSGVIEGKDRYRKLVRAGFAWAAPVSFDVHHLAFTEDDDLDIALADWTIRARRIDDGVLVGWQGLSVCDLARRANHLVARAPSRAAGARRSKVPGFEVRRPIPRSGRAASVRGRSRRGIATRRR